MLASLQRAALPRAFQAAAFANQAIRSMLGRRSYRRPVSIVQLNDHVLRDIGLQRAAALAPRRSDGDEAPAADID